MVQLGMTNSRMKDNYDLWFISSHFEFEGSTLAAAVQATFERRRTEIPRRAPIALTEEYAADLDHVRQWVAFTKSLGVEAPPGLGVVIDKISECCRNRAAFHPALGSSKWVAASWMTSTQLTERYAFTLLYENSSRPTASPSATSCARSAEYETRQLVCTPCTIRT